jgi:curved DNA-binding protein CbpA
MSTRLYELLGVAPDAPAEEIKRAFRREIAKYHPDKVQHLGKEFQEIAAVKSAELTRAYKTLSEIAARAECDEGHGGPAAPARPAPPPLADEEPAAPPRPAEPGPVPRPRSEPARPSSERAVASDLVRKAAVIRFRQAVDQEFGRCDDTPVSGFEISCAPPKGRFWSKVPPRILARFVPQVDAAAVSESWALARAQRDEHRELCVFVMGPVVAPVAQLARAIADQMRKPGGTGKISLVPVNTRTWAAEIPRDAPPAVRSLATRLKSF